MLSIAKYGLTVVAPTPIKTTKECVSRTSELSTFIEQNPLKPSFTKCECTAPTVKTEGILARDELIFCQIILNCYYLHALQFLLLLLSFLFSLLTMSKY